MSKKRNLRVPAIVTVGIFALVLVFLAIKFFGKRAEIPELSDMSTLSDPVQQQISEAIKQVKRNPSAKNLGLLGMVYHSSANYPEASNCYTLAAERDDSQWIWNYYQAYLQGEMGESALAIEYYQHVLEVDPENHHAWYYCGESYANLGEYEQAEQCFHNIAGIQKRTPNLKNITRRDFFSIGTYASYQLSRIYLNSNRSEQAEKTLMQLIKNDHLFGQAYRLLGNIQTTKGDIKSGEYNRLRATELMGVSEPVDTLIDKLVLTSRSDQFILTRIDDATRSVYSDWTLKLIDHAILYLPENKHLITKAIETWLWLDETEKARAYAGKHLSMFSDSETGLASMGKLFFSKNLLSETMLYFTRLLELNPEVLDNYRTLAICHWRLGDKKKALEVLNKIIELHPSNLNVLAYYTEILVFEFGSREIAERPLEILIKNAPSIPKVQKIRARFAETDGDIRQAIGLYEASIKGNHEDLTTITLLGNLLVRQKMWMPAIRHFELALDFHPNNPTFLERMGTLLIMSPDASVRNVEEGTEYALRAFTNSISSSSIRVSSGKSLSLAYAMQGNKLMANSIIDAVINIARHEKFSASELAQLEDLSVQFDQMEDKLILPVQ